MDNLWLTETVKEVVRELNSRDRMTLKLAAALAEVIEERAKTQGMRVVTAVADDHGHPVLVHSMDGAYLGSYDVALNKAYTAAAFRMSTKDLGEQSQPGGSLYGIQHTNGGRIVIIAGGYPLISGNRMIGALGVSGGTAKEDEELSAYGASRLKEVIKCL